VRTNTAAAIGGFGANHHLRQSLVFLDMPTLAQPRACVGNAAKLFDGQGGIAVPERREFLGTFLAAFAAWIERNAKAPAQSGGGGGRKG